MEKLPDGTLLVLIEGRQYRAIPAERMRELVNALADKKLLEEKVSLLQIQIAALEKVVSLGVTKEEAQKAESAALREQIALYKSLFEKADKASRPGRIRKFLDSPVSAILFQAVIPTITLLLRTR